LACKLLLATNNPGKVREYRRLLAVPGLELVTSAELGIKTAAEETGATLEDNARLKAIPLAAQSGLIALADDSGLYVDALDGEPGVHSARYAGEHASDGDRVAFLLKKLTGVPLEKRTAHFRCVIALATAAGEVTYARGECHGLIAVEPKGDNGFGYDPLFYLPDLGKTMAELSSEVKDRISHRGHAARLVPDLLRKAPFDCL